MLNRQVRCRDYHHGWTDYGNVTHEQAAINHAMAIRNAINRYNAETYDLMTRCTSNCDIEFPITVEFGLEPKSVKILRA